MDSDDLTTVFPQMIKNISALSFSWYDYIFFSMMLGLSALIGIYFGCFGSKQSSADEYLMGNKKMKVFPISVSLVASHISGLTLLAVPADIYRFGASYWLFLPASVVILFITIYLYLPVFYKLQITSTYEYLGRRFDNSNRMFASFLFALGLFLVLPLVIYVPAMAFSAATGINVHYVTPVVCGVCIFYTTLGGLKAVVWTDTLQFIVTVGATVTVCVLGIRSAGGVGAIWAKALEGHRLDIFDFDLDPTKRDSFWICIIGIGVTWFSMVGIHQSCVQKYLSVSTFRESKLTVLYFVIGVCVVSSIAVFIGLIMYARYAHCDPFTTGAVARNDQLLPYYIMDIASHVPGLPGLFIAGIFCAALSTLSASLNCLAGTMYEDFILKWTGRSHSDQGAGFILKSIVVVVGVICTALVFIVEHLGGLLPLAFSLGSVTQGPLLGMFTLGIFFPRASSKGALYGAVIGLLFTSWIITMSQYYKTQGLIVYEPKPTTTAGCYVNFTEVASSTLSTLTTTETSFTNFTLTNEFEETEKFQPFFLFRLSYYYYSPIAAFTTVVVGLFVSYFTKNDDPPVHRDLLSPAIHFMLSDEKVYNEKTDDYYSLNVALQLVTQNNEKEKD